MEQLLLVTSCDFPAGIGVSLQTDGWTDRLDVGNSILDSRKPKDKHFDIETTEKCISLFVIGL